MGVFTKIRLFIAIMKGGELVVDVYIALIVHHVRTIATVPAALQPAVLAGLTALGLDGNGDPLPAPEPTPEG